MYVLQKADFIHYVLSNCFWIVTLIGLLRYCVWAIQEVVYHCHPPVNLCNWPGLWIQVSRDSLNLSITLYRLCNGIVQPNASIMSLITVSQKKCTFLKNDVTLLHVENNISSIYPTVFLQQQQQQKYANLWGVSLK